MPGFELRLFVYHLLKGGCNVFLQSNPVGTQFQHTLTNQNFLFSVISVEIPLTTKDIKVLLFSPMET